MAINKSQQNPGHDAKYVTVLGTFVLHLWGKDYCVVLSISYQQRRTTECSTTYSAYTVVRRYNVASLLRMWPEPLH